MAWLVLVLFEPTPASLSAENISLYLCCYFKTFCLRNFFSAKSGYNSGNMIGSNQKIDGLFLASSTVQYIEGREDITNTAKYLIEPAR